MLRYDMLFLLFACHHGDESDGSVPPLLAEASVDCIPVTQPASDGTTAPSGYESCTVDGEGSFVHRVEAVDAAIDPTVAEDDWCNSGKASGHCASNAECGAGSVCESDAFGYCECVEKCRADSDCGAGSACIPNVSGVSGNYECLPAECRTDADCPSHWCVVSESTCGAGIPGSLHCFGPQDECLTPADCEGKPLCHVVDGAFRCDEQASCF